MMKEAPLPIILSPLSPSALGPWILERLTGRNSVEIGNKIELIQKKIQKSTQRIPEATNTAILPPNRQPQNFICLRATKTLTRVSANQLPCSML